MSGIAGAALSLGIRYRTANSDGRAAFEVMFRNTNSNDLYLSSTVGPRPLMHATESDRVEPGLAFRALRQQ